MILGSCCQEQVVRQLLDLKAGLDQTVSNPTYALCVCGLTQWLRKLLTPRTSIVRA